ncbi:hypothetical protein D9M73_155720 [compost metagenome]
MDIRLALHEVLHELRYPAAQRQAEHVVQYQYLAIGGAAGANADYRDANGIGDFRCQLAGYALEQQHGRTGLFQGNGVGAHLPGLGLLAALHFVAAQHVDGLRGQAHVRAHRHTTLGQQADGFGQPGCAFDFYHVGAGLHQCGAVGKGLLRRGVGHERQVGEDQRAVVAAFDAGGVVGHLRRGDRQGAVVALQDHPQRVAHQQHFNAGLAGGLGEGRVVAGQHGDFFTLGLEAVKGGKGYFRHVGNSSFRRCKKRLHSTRVVIFRSGTSSRVMFGHRSVRA